MRILFCNVFKANEACHRGNQCSKPADVGADDQGCVVIRKTRQQNRSWHIAHDLACQNCSDCLTSGHNTAEEMAELRNTSKVSNKNK